jgi:hypothetical protein
VLRDAALPLLRASSIAGLLAKARALRIAFPDDGLTVERIAEGLNEEFPFDAGAVSLSLARDLLALAEATNGLSRHSPMRSPSSRSLRLRSAWRSGSSLCSRWPRPSASSQG